MTQKDHDDLKQLGEYWSRAEMRTGKGILDLLAENQRMRELLAHASNAPYSGNLNDRIVMRREIESFLAEPAQ